MKLDDDVWAKIRAIPSLSNVIVALVSKGLVLDVDASNIAAHWVLESYYQGLEDFFKGVIAYWVNDNGEVKLFSPKDVTVMRRKE